MKKTENKKTNLEIYLVGGYILRLFLQPEAQKELTCPQVRLWSLHFQIDLQ
jgi:hypothetical protein